MGYIADLRAFVGHRTLINTGGRVIIEKPSGEVLLVRRKDFGIWGLPAGGMDIGEDMKTSVLREVREETGLELSHLTLVGVSSDPEFEQVTYPNGDQVQNMSLVLYATRWSGVLKTETEETSAAQFFAPHAMPKMLPHEYRSLQHFWSEYKSTNKPFLK